MKKIILFLIIASVALIISCGKPNELTSKFKIISTCADPGYAEAVTIGKINNTNYAFVASGQAGMVIYNIDNPESTYIVTQWRDTLPSHTVFSSCWSIAVLNNYAFLAYGSNELEILDASNLDSLIYVGDLTWPAAYAYDISVPDTNFAYIAAKQQFIITDISNLTNPIPVEQHHFPSDIRGVAVKDSFAYIACEQLGIYVINVKAAQYPIVSNCNTPSNARGLFIKDNTCYVADGRYGIVAIDITNPRTPVIIGELPLSGYATHIYVKDTLAYVSGEDAGVSIINVKDNTKPILLETVKTSYARGVCADSQYIYVADRDQGLVVIKQEE
jgi:hypothetical protein